MTKKPVLGRGRHITNDPAKLKDEMIDRILATECGLPKVCSFRLCRRNKRCFGPGVLCIKDHRGLFEKRFPRVVAEWPAPCKGTSTDEPRSMLSRSRTKH